MEENNEGNRIIWKDRKRIIFGLPWTFTRYSLSGEKLMVDTGLLNRKEEEIRLYRVLDITMERPLGQRIWGLGTIHLCTADKSTPEINIVRIRNPKAFKELLSEKVEAERDRKRIGAREYMSASDMDDDIDNMP